MTDFNKICYHAVMEILKWEMVQLHQIHRRMTVVYDEDAPSYAMQNNHKVRPLSRLASLIQLVLNVDLASVFTAMAGLVFSQLSAYF